MHQCMCSEIFFLFKVQGIYDSASYINKTNEAPCSQQESDFLLFSFHQIKRVTNRSAPLYPDVVFIKFLRVRSVASRKMLVLRRCS